MIISEDAYSEMNLFEYSAFFCFLKSRRRDFRMDLRPDYQSR